MQTAAPDLIGLAVQAMGMLLFFVLFLLVWRQSGIISLGSWTLAWLLEAMALVFVWFYFSSGQPAWLTPYSFLEYSYALALAAAARMENLGAPKSWNHALRGLAGYPVFLAIAYVLGLQHRFETNIVNFMSLVEASKHYPCVKRAWIEYLGEHPEPAIDRVQTESANDRVAVTN